MHAETTARKTPRNFERHYQAIIAEAERVGWPKKFRTDLTKHDRAWLAERDASKPFTWVLREDGTHIAAPGIIDGVGHRASEYARMVAKSFSHQACRFYVWDGVGLKEYATAAQADTRMLEIEIELGLDGWYPRRAR